MPDMTQCTRTTEPQIRTFCGTDANVGGYGRAAAAVCLLPRQRNGIFAPPSPVSVGTTAPPLPPTADPCLSDPSQASCAGYVYPAASVQADSDRLCRAMPDMAGCTIREACQVSGVLSWRRRDRRRACQG